MAGTLGTNITDAPIPDASPRSDSDTTPYGTNPVGEQWASWDRQVLDAGGCPQGTVAYYDVASGQWRCKAGDTARPRTGTTSSRKTTTQRIADTARTVTAPVTEPISRRTGFPWWLILIGILVAVGILLWWLMKD